MDQPITLASVTPQDDPISLNSGAASANYLLSPDAIANRSFRASYGLANTAAAMPTTQIAQGIANGEEDAIRTQAATKLNEDASIKRMNAIASTLGNRDTPLSFEDMQKLTTQQSYSPNSVFEWNFANQHLSEIDAFGNRIGPDTGVFPAINSLTDAQAMRMFGTISMAQNQYLMTKAQNIQSMIDNQSTVGFAADFMKMAFPFFNPYFELKMRSNVPGVSFFDGFLGSNLDEQRRKLHSLEFPQFTDTIDKIVDHLAKDNPQAAMAFVASMLGQSSNEYMLNQINTFGNLTDIPTALGVARALGRPLYSSFSLANQARRAYQTILQSSAVTPEPTPATISASVGDLARAGTQRASAILGKNAGEITDSGLDQLPVHMRVDMANIKENPGPFTDTFVNRVVEQYQMNQDKLLDRLMTTTRPFTAPVENATPEFLAKLAEDTYSRYPGLSNNIIKFEDAYREPISRRLFQPAWIGRKAGEFFTSEEEALAYARLHNLPLEYTPEQISNLEMRINAVKEELKHGPDLHDDTAGLNYFYGLEKQLKDLQAQLEAGKAAPKSGIKILSAKTPPKTVPETDARIAQLRERVKEPPAIDEDTAGLNSYFAAQEELRNLEASASVDQQGLGFYIKLTKPIDETSPLMRQWIYDRGRPESVSPDSWTKYIPFAQKARTPEDTMSAEHRLNRLAAIYPQGNMLNLVAEEGKNLLALNKQERKTLTEVLKFSQDAPDPHNEGKPGYYFENLKDLADHYLRVYNRNPTEAEAAAYFSVKKWSHDDHMFRNIALYRNMSRWGAESQQVIAGNGQGGQFKSSAFHGKNLNEFPGGSGSNILIVGKDFKDSGMVAVESIPKKQKNEYTKQIKGGNKVLVQLWDPESVPFKGLVEGGDNLTHYVLADRIETSPLNWNILPFRGGGHNVYEAPLYLKVPIMKFEEVKGGKRSVYLGDRTVAAVNFTKDGKDAADKFNQVGILIANDKLEAAKAFYETHMNAYESWKEFIAKWHPVKDADGNIHPPVFQKEFFKRPGGIKEYFKVVPKNKSIADLDSNLELKFGSEYVDGTRQHSPARNFQVEFTGQRDAENLRTIENVGTQSNPIYNFRPTEKVDPVKIMTRGLSSIIHSTFMDDYKTYAVETLLREVLTGNNGNPLVKDELISRFASSPFWSFKTLSKDMFKSGIPVQDVEKILANKFKIDQLVGIPSKLDTFIASGAQAMADSLYDKTGNQKLTVVPTWILPRLKDPFAFLRSVAFNAYLGLFYLPQFFVQSMGFVNVHAISPLHAPAGTMAMYLYQLSRINSNPEILNALDKIASTVHLPGFARFRPGQWMEAVKELDETGFAHVAGEVAQLATLGKTGVYNESWFNRFLTLGQTPFREGERAVRLGAWFTAYLEHRAQNATGAISEMDRAKIMQRADLLYGNMSSASNSMLHSGVLSLPTQFFSYQIRLAEQFWGKRLGDTPAQRMAARARIFAYNAAMFGVPTAMGVTGLPVGDWFRSKMLEESQAADRTNLQYVTGTPLRWLRSLTGTTSPYSVLNTQARGNTRDWIEHMFMEGFPASGLSWIFGQNYNVGPRYGLGGTGPIKDLLFGDPKFWELLGGASGKLLMNFLGPNKDGFVNAVTSIMRKDPVQWQIKSEDFLNLFGDVQTFRHGMQLAWALNTGTWVNQNGRYIQDVGKLNAMFMTAFGLNPQLQTDMYLMQLNLKDQEDLQKEAMKRAGGELSKGFIALSNRDFNNADDYFKRSVVWMIGGNVSDKDIAKTMSRSVKDNDPAIEQIAWSRYVQNAPKGYEQQYYKMYELIHNALKGTK